MGHTFIFNDHGTWKSFGNVLSISDLNHNKGTRALYRGERGCMGAHGNIQGQMHSSMKETAFVFCPIILARNDDCGV